MLSAIPILDLAVIVAYVVGTTALALWLARRQRDTRSYFVGDRNVSWWLILFSIVATETSTVTFLSAPGLAYNPAGGNLTFLQLALGYALGRLLVAWLLLPQYLRGELLSVYQLLRQRFNPVVQRTASGLFLLTRTVADGLRLYLTGLLLQQFTQWDIATSVLAMGVVTIFYTYLGGMQAVIWTDLLQFVVYVLGAIVAAGFILNQVGGTEVFLAEGIRADKFTVFNFALDLRQPYTFVTGLIGGAFFSMASHGADHLMVQRYLCARSLAEARTAVVLSGVVVFVQFALFLLIGVGLFVLYTQGQIPDQPRDAVFGYFIMEFLPPGVVGLIIAAVLAAAMSTLSSSLNSSSGAFVSDFYRPLRSNRAEDHYLLVSRLMTLFWGVAQIGVALVFALVVPAAVRDRSIIDHVLTVAGFTTGIILGLFLLGSLKKPVQSNAALVGMVAGALAVLAVWLPSTWGETLLAWPWLAPVGTMVTVLVALLVNRLIPIKHEPKPAAGSPDHRSA